MSKEGVKGGKSYPSFLSLPPPPPPPPHTHTHTHIYVCGGTYRVILRTVRAGCHPVAIAQVVEH